MSSIIKKGQVCDRLDDLIGLSRIESDALRGAVDRNEILVAVFDKIANKLEPTNPTILQNQLTKDVLKEIKDIQSGKISFTKISGTGQEYDDPKARITALLQLQTFLLKNELGSVKDRKVSSKKAVLELSGANKVIKDGDSEIRVGMLPERVSPSRRN